MLSLNDSYWVVPGGFAGTFTEYNLYENRFAEVLSLVAYTGVGQSNQAFTTSWYSPHEGFPQGDLENSPDHNQGRN